MRCDRFVIEKRAGLKKYNSGKLISVEYFYTIYDRVTKKDIIEIKSEYDGLNKEFAESILTMLNIKYIGVKEDE